jgi:hypothetical protein
MARRRYKEEAVRGRGVGRGLAIAVAGAAAALAAPAAAGAAVMSVGPQKQCYRAGEQLAIFGNGFSPNGGVNVSRDGVPVGSVSTNPAGVFAGRLTLGGPGRGERVFGYTAVDRANPFNRASIPLRVSAIRVWVRPARGTPGRPLRIKARGFTTGRTLYAHIRRGRRYRRNMRIGRLRGACATVSRRKTVFRRGTRTGTYLVHFDARRRFTRSNPIRVSFRVRVFRRSRASAATAASVGERWVLAD